MKKDSIHKFVGDQLSRWPLACSNFRELKNVRLKDMDAGGLTVKLHINNNLEYPKRMRASNGSLHPFFCAKNLAGKLTFYGIYVIIS